ncbi:hypothetical protein [Serratia fonticola]
MAGAVILKSRNTLTAGRSPIALGNALHLDASRARLNGDVVYLPDYLNSALIFSPIAVPSGDTPSSPVIQIVNGFDELNFPRGAGLASLYDSISGDREVTFYLVVKLNLAAADASGVVFRWLSAYTGVSATDQGFILRKYGSNKALQFLIDSGVPTSSITQEFNHTGYVVIALGWSVENNIHFMNVNGTEVSSELPVGVVGAVGSGHLSFAYSPEYKNQRCPMGLRMALGYRSYHDALTRQAMVTKLMTDHNIQ